MTAEKLWDWHLPDQACAGCGLERPGQACQLQDGLPIPHEEGEDDAEHEPPS